VSGSGIFSKGRDGDPNRYDSVLAEMRQELAKV
jgi:ribulose-phosphate 3-epimerase